MYERGKKARGVHMVVFALPTERDQVRLGITATRRIGGAVVRNRARRRIRELFRLHRTAWEPWTLDTVVNCRIGCSVVPWAELERDFLRCVEILKHRLGRHERQ